MSGGATCRSVMYQFNIKGTATLHSPDCHIHRRIWRRGGRVESAALMVYCTNPTYFLTVEKIKKCL